MNPAGLLKYTRWVALERPVALQLLHSPRMVQAIGRRRQATVEGRTLDPQFAAVISIDDFTGPVDVSRFDVPEARWRLKHGVGILDLAAPRGGTVTRLEVKGAEGMLPARLYAPENLPKGSPLVVYFHGGGFVTLDLDTHESFCRHLAQEGKLRVVSVGYRLAPEAQFPAAARDAVASFCDLAGRAEELGADPGRLAVMGDSAGGNLAAVVAQRTRRGPAQPALQVLLYPAVDLTLSFPSHQTYSAGYLLTKPGIEWYLNRYAGPEVDRRNPELSPYFGDVAGVAPALIYTAGFDPLRDEGQAYAQRLAEAGVAATSREFPSLCHGFALMRDGVEAARTACDEIIGELAGRLGA